MNNSDIIQEIIESKKNKVYSLGIDSDVNYLMFESNLPNWIIWIENQPSFWRNNFSNFVTDKKLGQEYISHDNNEFISYQIELNNCSFRFDISQTFQNSYVDNFTSYGDLFLYHNDQKVCEFELTRNFDEYINDIHISEVKGFIDGEWVKDLKIFVKNYEDFQTVISDIYKEQEIIEKNEKLKLKFGISEQEIERFKKKENTFLYFENSSKKIFTYYIGFNLIKIYEYIKKLIKKHSL